MFGNSLDLFSKSSDVRIEDRFGISSPVPLTVIMALYLLIVFIIGPSYMKSRPPYKLKCFIIIYNVFQVTSCFYIVSSILTSSIPILRFWECERIEKGSLLEKEINHIGILTFWLKASELSETLVFVLRKKQRQVSFLHVFHHSSMLFLTYKIINTYKASSALFPLFLNCTVHIIMYCYYLMAAILPTSWVDKLTPIKKAITTIQMIQFTLILAQVASSIAIGCNVPKMLLLLYMAIVSAFFYMFYDFYKKNYNAKRPLQQ